MQLTKTSVLINTFILDKNVLLMYNCIILINKGRYILVSNKHEPQKHVDFTEKEIKEYIQALKLYIKSSKYSISINRKKNMDFIEDYKIDTQKEKEILLSLTYKDFCYAVDNKKEKYFHETLYVFCKRRKLGYWGSLRTVDIYLKTNIVETSKGEQLYIVSFHEKEKKLQYLFRDKGYF